MGLSPPPYGCLALTLKADDFNTACVEESPQEQVTATHSVGIVLDFDSLHVAKGITNASFLLVPLVPLGLRTAIDFLCPARVSTSSSGFGFQGPPSSCPPRQQTCASFAAARVRCPEGNGGLRCKTSALTMPLLSDVSRTRRIHCSHKSAACSFVRQPLPAPVRNRI